MHPDLETILHYSKPRDSKANDGDMKDVFVNRIEEKYRSLYDNYSPDDMTHSDFSCHLSALKCYALMSIGAEDRQGRSSKEIAEKAKQAAIWLDSFIRPKASDSD